MATYSLSTTFHVRTAVPIDGSAGFEIPRACADLAAASRYVVIELPDDANAEQRKRQLVAAVAGLVARLPAGLRRGFEVDVGADGGTGLDGSRWDPRTKTWIPDGDGLSVVFPLVQRIDGAIVPITFRRSEDGVGPQDGRVVMEMAVTAREV